MSTSKPLPRHGTRARYRLEIKTLPDGSKGVACDRCKAANSKEVAAARSRRAANARRAELHIVDEPAVVIQPADADTDSTADTSPEKPGPMETAIAQDIEEIPTELRVPMHRSLAMLAVQTARDFDRAVAHTARASARRELADLIKSLRTRREGDGNTALDAYFEDFGTGAPRVPERRA